MSRRASSTRGDLAAGADEKGREEIRTGCRMVMPISDEALEQVRSEAQDRAVGRRGPTDHDVLTAPGAGVAAVGHELLW